MVESLSDRPTRIGSPFVPTSTRSALKECEALGQAITGDVGEIVEKVQKLILHYYDDVREQAERSLRIARRTAIAGFVVFIATLSYLVVIDFAYRAKWFPDPPAGAAVEKAGGGTMTIGSLGVIAGLIVEILAGTQFALQGRATKQFGAFHICLERTHRYLLAYKIAEKMTENRDETLAKIVCIMANAPMITRDDVDAVGSATSLTPTGTPPSPSAFAAMS
jgi:hypothetical protein